MEIRPNPHQLLKCLKLMRLAKCPNDTEPFQITAAFNHRKRGVESKLILGLKPTPHPDPVLILNVAKARLWLEQIKQGTTLAELAAQENRTIRQIQRHLELTFLSPTLLQKIVEGLQPPEMSSRHLVRTPILMDWTRQDRLVGL